MFELNFPNAFFDWCVIEVINLYSFLGICVFFNSRTIRRFPWMILQVSNNDVIEVRFINYKIDET